MENVEKREQEEEEKRKILCDEIFPAYREQFVRFARKK